MEYYLTDGFHYLPPLPVESLDYTVDANGACV